MDTYITRTEEIRIGNRKVRVYTGVSITKMINIITMMIIMMEYEYSRVHLPTQMYGHNQNCHRNLIENSMATTYASSPMA